MGYGQDLHSRPSSPYRSSLGEGSAQGRRPVLDRRATRPLQHAARSQDHCRRRHDVVRVRVARSCRLPSVRHPVPRAVTLVSWISQTFLQLVLLRSSSSATTSRPSPPTTRRPRTRMPTQCCTPHSRSSSTCRLRTERSLRSWRKSTPSERESHRSPWTRVTVRSVWRRIGSDGRGWLRRCPASSDAPARLEQQKRAATCCSCAGQ